MNDINTLFDALDRFCDKLDQMREEKKRLANEARAEGRRKAREYKRQNETKTPVQAGDCFAFAKRYVKVVRVYKSYAETNEPNIRLRPYYMKSKLEPDYGFIQGRKVEKLTKVPVSRFEAYQKEALARKEQYLKEQEEFSRCSEIVAKGSEEEIAQLEITDIREDFDCKAKLHKCVTCRGWVIAEDDWEDVACSDTCSDAFFRAL